MMDSLLNRKKSTNTSIGSLSIEILPEFGWPRGNQRTFGPGTLFQGYVIVKCNESSVKATRLRLIFQGSEAMLTDYVGPGVIRTQTNVLFSVRSVLWQKTDENELLNTSTVYKFLFTIQMPLVQYPPSMDHDFYRCCYKLSAYLDPSLGYGEVPVTAQTKLDYIPLTETKLLKHPLYIEDLKRKKQISPISIKLHSIQYLSGDIIQANICTTNNRTSPNNSSSSAALANFEYRVTLNLYQISKFNVDTEPILVRLVCTQSHIIKIDDTVKSNSSEQLQHPVSLKINEELPPSFDYSRILSLSYKLKVKVYIKKINTPLSSISNDSKSGKKVKEIMTMLPWTTATMSIFETPIIIGTMGRGIRAMDGLRAYSQFTSDDPPSTPKFVKNLIHEDELPKYEPARLPLYNDSYNHERLPVTSTISAASPVTIIRSIL